MPTFPGFCKEFPRPPWPCSQWQMQNSFSGERGPGSRSGSSGQGEGPEDEGLDHDWSTISW